MDTFDPQIERSIRDSFARQQAMTTIGASVVAIRAGEVEIELPFSPALGQQHGFVHAGFIAMIADNACGYAALSLAARDAAVLTAEFKVHFLSPAKGEKFLAIGRVVRPGRTLSVCLGEVFALDGESRKQVALMTASMRLMENAGLRG
jgi:uncharacterized protein (TIGR00369 family)